MGVEIHLDKVKGVLLMDDSDGIKTMLIYFTEPNIKK